MEKLRNIVLVVLTCLAVILIVLAGVEAVKNNHFSVGSLVEQAAAVPEFPALDWTGDFLGTAGSILTYCGDMITWVFSFNPWVSGVPSYRPSGWPFHTF